MELAGAGYLYALATLSITFSGFSALITVLRQAAGGTLSRYDAFLMVNYFMSGFAIAVVCLLPPLICGLGASPTAAWRGSSLFAGSLGFLVEGITWMRRRSEVGGPMPFHVIAISLSYLPGFLLLLLSGCSLAVAPGFGPFAASLTWTFLMAGIDYVIALHLLFSRDFFNDAPNPPVHPLRGGW